MGNEYRFYIQKRNDQYEGYTNIWVECQHFILNRGAITVIQIDELRPVDEYWMSENDFPEPPIKFDSFNSWGGPVGIASKAAKVDYVSLESFLEQFLNPRPAPSDLGWKPRNPIFKLRERPDYVTIPSLCEEYERKGLSYQ
ncbi:TPA: hypothetical protein ACXYK5_002271 [Legionella pneumophila]